MALRAEPEEGKAGVEGKVDFLNLQIEGLRRQIETMNLQSQFTGKRKEDEINLLSNKLVDMALHHVRSVTSSTDRKEKEIHLRLPKAIPLEVLEEMASLTHLEGMKLKVSVGKEETEMQIGSPGDND